VKLAAATALLVPFGVVTTIACTDALCAGDTAVIEVSDTTVKLFAANEPNPTAVAPVNPVPVTVTVVFPVVGPDVGEIPVTVGRTTAEAGPARTAIGTATTATSKPRTSPLNTDPPLWSVLL
jgi:hypothetical protein